MKNLFKTGFLAFALSLFLTSCDFFNSSAKTTQIDSNKVDSSSIDSLNQDSNVIDSTKIKLNTVKK